MRLHDWQLRFAALIEQHQATPFAWGVFDCATFAADVVKAVTGRDIYADLEIAYADEKSALRWLKKNGSLRELAAKHVGEEVAQAFAQIGDIGWLNTGPTTRETLAVFGGRCWLTPAVDFGLARCEEPAEVWRNG
jgi:hypothetical protein